MSLNIKKIVAAAFLASTLMGSGSRAIPAPDLVFPITSFSLGFLFYQRNHYTYKDLYPWVGGTKKVIVDSIFSSAFCFLPAVFGHDRAHAAAIGSACVVGVIGGAVSHYTDAMKMPACRKSDNP